MTKRIFLIVHLSLIALACAFAHGDDPVVMTIAGKNVTRSEFEYNFNKNNSDNVIDRKNIEEYAELFIAYRLKVQAALDARMDTAKAFRKEFRQYRDQQIRPMLIPETKIELECESYYDNMLKSLGGKDLIRPAHIFLHVPQQSDAATQQKARDRADSIYNALLQGADFAELAKICSDDHQTASRGGLFPWIGPGSTIQEFEDVAYSLSVGETSKPFLSTVGYHIIRMVERKSLEPFDTLHAQIHEFLERRGVCERLSQQILDSLSTQYNGAYTVEEILDAETDRLCAQDQDLKYLVQEYHDGLLMFDLCSQQIWEPAKKDTTGLVSYFKSHRKAYAWPEPHYLGMLYHCQKASDVKAVQQLLKKLPQDKWVSEVRKTFNKDSVTVRMELRMFKKGENANVDVLAFKSKGIETKPLQTHPYMGIAGKVLKKGPSSWTDVSAQVVQDYQKFMEDKYVANLRKKYAVSINREVLATVNKH